MSIETSLLAGIAVGVAGVISIVKPLISSYLQRKMVQSLRVSLMREDGAVRTIELHGETGSAAIEKLMRDLMENKPMEAKDGENTSNAK